MILICYIVIKHLEWYVLTSVQVPSSGYISSHLSQWVRTCSVRVPSCGTASGPTGLSSGTRAEPRPGPHTGPHLTWPPPGQLKHNTTRQYRATFDLATARAAETQHNTSIQGHIWPGHRPGSWNTTQHVNTGPHPTWPPPGQLKHNTTRQYRATSDLATARAAEIQHNTSIQGHTRPGHRPGSWNTTQNNRGNQHFGPKKRHSIILLPMSKAMRSHSVVTNRPIRRDHIILKLSQVLTAVNHQWQMFR